MAKGKYSSAYLEAEVYVIPIPRATTTLAPMYSHQPLKKVSIEPTATRIRPTMTANFLPLFRIKPARTLPMAIPKLSTTVIMREWFAWLSLSSQP